MMSGHGTVDSAVEALHSGAEDFLEKPLSTARLLVTIGKALETRQLKIENSLLRDQSGCNSTLVGHSPNDPYATRGYPARGTNPELVYG
ncbi:MAG: hypothetical protein CM1200mP41_13190 [Gammaproteobacteria bacterium]|nr:MAG: hypothetical protein CM1200mP41_13190 [Gammaproteobacteria bacterium]